MNKKDMIYDEKNGLWYERQGDYYIPCLVLPEEEPRLSAFGGSVACGILSSIGGLFAQRC